MRGEWFYQKHAGLFAFLMVATRNCHARTGSSGAASASAPQTRSSRGFSLRLLRTPKHPAHACRRQLLARLPSILTASRGRLCHEDVFPVLLRFPVPQRSDGRVLELRLDHTLESLKYCKPCLVRYKRTGLQVAQLVYQSYPRRVLLDNTLRTMINHHATTERSSHSRFTVLQKIINWDEIRWHDPIREPRARFYFPLHFIKWNNFRPRLEFSGAKLHKLLHQKRVRPLSRRQSIQPASDFSVRREKL